MRAEPQVEVRPLAASDLEAVVRIERLCFPDPWPRSAFASELETEAPPLAAAVDGPVVGYLCRMLGPGELHITNLAIDPAFRRRGVARSLLSRAIQEAEAQGADWTYLDVRPSNTAARALYTRLGFREIFRRKKYYIRPQEDALILARPRGGSGAPAAEDPGTQRKRSHGVV